MNKIILIFYINVSNMEHDEIPGYMEEIANRFNSREDNILAYFIPVDRETTVDCINPKLVSEEDYAEAKRVLDKNQEIVNKMIR